MAHDNRANASSNLPMEEVNLGFDGNRHRNVGGSRTEVREKEETPTNGISTTRQGNIKGMLDANVYATKKTIAQGMLDVALLTANASQLKYLLQIGQAHEFYHLMLVLISLSIILQVVVGILFIVIGLVNVNDEKQQRLADILNNIITVGIFCIAVLNIMISSFGMKDSDDHFVFMPPT